MENGIAGFIIKMIDPPDIRKTYKLRRRAIHMILPHSARSGVGCIERYIAADDGYKIPVRVYTPNSPVNIRSFRVIVYFHGGGWVTDDTETYYGVCRRLAAASGSIVICPGYRLAPENKYPIGFNDCYTVARSIYDYFIHKGCSQNNIVLAGDSAGGNLASVVALRALKENNFHFNRMILLYPVTACDYNESSPYTSVKEKGRGCILTAKRMKEYLELYLGYPAKSIDDPYIAPIKAHSLAGMPKTLVITAENDPLRDEGEAFAKRLFKCGCYVSTHRIRGSYHGFFARSERCVHVRRALKIINLFLKLTD